MVPFFSRAYTTTLSDSSLSRTTPTHSCRYLVQYSAAKELQEYLGSEGGADEQSSHFISLRRGKTNEDKQNALTGKQRKGDPIK